MKFELTQFQKLRVKHTFRARKCYWTKKNWDIAILTDKYGNIIGANWVKFELSENVAKIVY